MTQPEIQAMFEALARIEALLERIAAALEAD